MSGSLGAAPLRQVGSFMTWCVLQCTRVNSKHGENKTKKRRQYSSVDQLKRFQDAKRCARVMLTSLKAALNEGSKPIQYVPPGSAWKVVKRINGQGGLSDHPW